MLDSLFTDEELSAIFSEPRYVAQMLAAERRWRRSSPAGRDPGRVRQRSSPSWMASFRPDQ